MMPLPYCTACGARFSADEPACRRCGTARRTSPPGPLGPPGAGGPPAPPGYSSPFRDLPARPRRRSAPEWVSLAVLWTVLLIGLPLAYFGSLIYVYADPDLLETAAGTVAVNCLFGAAAVGAVGAATAVWRAGFATLALLAATGLAMASAALGYGEALVYGVPVLVLTGMTGAGWILRRRYRRALAALLAME
jgi:hypothetical protein